MRIAVIITDASGMMPAELDVTRTVKTFDIPDEMAKYISLKETDFSDEQRWQMFRRYLATENDVFMTVFQDGVPPHPTEAQLDALCDAAINSAIAAGATP